MDPVILFIISLTATILLFGVLIYFVKSEFSKLRESQNNKDDEAVTKWLESMQGTMDVRLKNVQDQLDKTTDSLNKNLNERLDKASEVMNSVHKELGSMSEIGRNMRDLQDFLKSPKLRGNIGEEVLKDLLEQMIPRENFKLQYQFKSGGMVDAVLMVEEGLIPVDSKFPLENFSAMMQLESEEDRDAARKLFNRDLKKHVNDISSKYILPEEGTVDFALMYLPSEAIYYEVVVNSDDLGKYAWQNRVLPVSPNVFYSYLKAILIGLEGKKVESKAHEIMLAIRGIKNDTEKFGDSLRLMNKHLSNAKNTSDDVTKNYERLSMKINNIDNLPQGSKEKISRIE